MENNEQSVTGQAIIALPVIPSEVASFIRKMAEKGHRNKLLDINWIKSAANMRNHEDKKACEPIVKWFSKHPNHHELFLQAVLNGFQVDEGNHAGIRSLHSRLTLQRDFARLSGQEKEEFLLKWKLDFLEDVLDTLGIHVKDVNAFTDSPYKVEDIPDYMKKSKDGSSFEQQKARVESEDRVCAEPAIEEQEESHFSAEAIALGSSVAPPYFNPMDSSYPSPRGF